MIPPLRQRDGSVDVAALVIKSVGWVVRRVCDVYVVIVVKMVIRRTRWRIVRGRNVSSRRSHRG